jgi:uncharacterized RDD family membrane protein YckC
MAGVLFLLAAIMVQAFFSALPFRNRVVVLVFFVAFGGLCYFPGMECSTARATPGKRLCGITVADLNGGKISSLRAVGRNLLKFLLLVLFPVSIVMMVKGTKRQSLHERLAGTLVLLRH